jgi:hypothetical protein
LLAGEGAEWYEEERDEGEQRRDDDDQRNRFRAAVSEDTPDELVLVIGTAMRAALNNPTATNSINAAAAAATSGEAPTKRAANRRPCRGTSR